MGSVKPYYECEKTLQYLQKLSVESRIAWHSRRIKKERKVHEQVDRILMSTTSLKVLRVDHAANLEFEDAVCKCLQVLKSPEFAGLQARQMELSKRLLHQSHVKGDLLLNLLGKFPDALTKTMLSPTAATLIQKVIDAITREDELFEDLIELDLQVERIAAEVGLVPSQFLAAEGLFKTLRSNLNIRRFCAKYLKYEETPCQT